jgi:hypothetical protein
MKQNYKKLFLAFLVINFLVVEFFGFITTSHAANCNYTISFGGDRTTALPNDTVNFTATVTRAGASLSSCDNSVDISLYVTAGSSTSFITTHSPSFSGNNGSSTTTAFSYGLSNLPRNTTTANFTAKVFSKSGTGLTTSSPWTVNITSSSSSSGGVSLNFNPTKGSYNIGESVGIFASMSSSLYSQAQSNNVKDVYFKLIINGGSGYDSTTLPLSNFSGQAAANYGTIDITTDNGFKIGPNSVTIELWAAGTSIKLGSGSSNINVGQSTAPNAIADNQSPAMGSTVHISIQNPPSGNWTAKIFVNDYSDAINIGTGSTPYSLVINTDNGFDNAGKNTVIVQIFDSSGTQVGPDNTITLNVGGGTTPPATAACTGTGQSTCASGQTCQSGTCQGASNNPADTKLNTTLYNAFLVIAQGLLAILGVFAVVFIIVGGFQMLTSAGNEETLMKAKKTIIWAILGLVVALMSFSIIVIVEDILQVTIKTEKDNSAPTPKTYPTYDACIKDNTGIASTDPRYNSENFCETFPQK